MCMYRWAMGSAQLQTCTIGTMWESDPVWIVSTFRTIDRADGRIQLDGFENHPLHSHVNQIIIGGNAVDPICDESPGGTDVVSFACQCVGINFVGHRNLSVKAVGRWGREGVGTRIAICKRRTNPRGFLDRQSFDARNSTCSILQDC